MWFMKVVYLGESICEGEPRPLENKSNEKKYFYEFASQNNKILMKFPKTSFTIHERIAIAATPKLGYRAE